MTVITGVLLDENVSFTLAELCRTCEVPAETLIDMVEESLIEPIAGGIGTSPRNWRFSAQALLRARKALRLQHDLGINLAGVALALDLMDEVRELQRRLKSLEHQAFGD